MNRDRFLPLGLGLILLIGCASTGPRPDTTVASAPLDWAATDASLPRDLLVARERWFGNIRGLASRQDIAGLGQDAGLDTLDERTLDSLSVPEHAARRHAARQQVRRAGTIIRARAQGLLGDPSPAATSRLDTTLSAVWRHLVSAVRLDPEQADAWHDLAYVAATAGDQATASLARRRYLDLALGVSMEERSRRCRVVLDEAWYLRDDGRHERARLWLMGYSRLLNTSRHAPQALAPRVERDLIMGLLAAEQDLPVEAGRWLQRLPLVKVWTEGRAEDSEYLRTWVLAWLQHSRGNAVAVEHFLSHTRIARLHDTVGWRYWQDLGLAAEAVGKPAIAQIYWDRAQRERPFPGFFPHSVVPGPGDAFGATGAGQPSWEAYHTHGTVGSLWSYAVSRVVLCQIHPIEEDPWLWWQAENLLARCVRRGLRTGEARLLRARLALQKGDLAAAAADLEHDSVTRLAAGTHAAEVALLRAVAALAGHDVGLAGRLLAVAVRSAPNQTVTDQARALQEVIDRQGDDLMDSSGPRRWLLPTPIDRERAERLEAMIAAPGEFPTHGTRDDAETIRTWRELRYQRLTTPDTP